MEVLFNATMYFRSTTMQNTQDGSFLEVDFFGLFGANKMMEFSRKFNRPLRKHIKSFRTPSKDYGRIEWKRTFKDALHVFMYLYARLTT